MGSLEIHHGSTSVSGAHIVILDTSTKLSYFVHLIRSNGGPLFYTLDLKTAREFPVLRFVTLDPPATSKEDAKRRVERYMHPHSVALFKITDSERMMPVRTWHRLTFK
jgi:hypothetical protein